jgi:predicted TIM-barrel fold metal-dependent hydrolase
VDTNPDSLDGSRPAFFTGLVASPGSMFDARYVVISADCHTGAPAAAYRSSLDPQFRDQYDLEVESSPAPINADVETFERYFRGNSRHLAPDRNDKNESWSAVFRAAFELGDGMWESGNRLRALEADGVVGEVLYPASQMTAGVPFGPTSGGAPGSDDPELVAAGVLAYNRWLADLCGEAPARHAGIAQTSPLSDVDRVEDAVAFAAEHGLRGGISMPALADGGVDWQDPSCDRVWARCEEAGLPVNVHGGLVRDRTTPPVSNGPGATALATTNAVAVARRPLWSFIAGGVFDRFPRLQPTRIGVPSSRRASTGLGIATSARRSSAGPKPRRAPTSVSGASCSAPTSRTPKARARSPAKRSDTPSKVSHRQSCGRCSGRLPRPSMASTWGRSRRWRHGSGRRSTRSRLPFASVPEDR